MTPQITEGPEIVEFPNPTGRRYLLYYDCFMDNRYGISSSDDLLTFTEITGSSCLDYGDSTGISMPGGNSTKDGPRHGSFVRLTEAELAVLRGFAWPDLRANASLQC
eukprot:SAG22_NODE_2024_length_3122_cov_2.375455_2_plen_107_part_00